MPGPYEEPTIDGPYFPMATSFWATDILNGPELRVARTMAAVLPSNEAGPLDGISVDVGMLRQSMERPVPDVAPAAAQETATRTSLLSVGLALVLDDLGAHLPRDEGLVAVREGAVQQLTERGLASTDDADDADRLRRLVAANDARLRAIEDEGHLEALLEMATVLLAWRITIGSPPATLPLPPNTTGIRP